MKASELKGAIRKFINSCDDGPYSDEARRYLNDFAEDLFPELAKRRARINAMKKLSAEEIKLLGLKAEVQITDEDSDDVVLLTNWIKRYREISPFSNSRDTALEGLLKMVRDDNADEI